MKKYIVVLMLFLLSGCHIEYRLICDQNGRMYSVQGTNMSAKPFYNSSQTCINQTDGSILVKSVNK